MSKKSYDDAVFFFSIAVEIGDFLEEEYHDHGYLKTLKILHNPSDNMLMKVMEYHKTHM